MELPVDPLRPPVEGYAGRTSYQAGETLTLHTSSDVDSFTVEIARVGREREVVWRREGIRGVKHATPPDAASNGCRWPAAIELQVPHDWRSGYYEADLIPEQGEPAPLRCPAFFALRSAPNGGRAPILLVLTTATYNAYNDWGGQQIYTGGVRVSYERPLAPGFLAKPDVPDLRAATAQGRYDPELAYQRAHMIEHRLSPWCLAAGWWNWERPFVEWAEGAGYELDYAVNEDLELHPDVLDGRRLVISVGHDEYWSWGMRDSLEAFVASGGNVAFFSGNVSCSQVRFEDDGRAFVCYKYDVPADPVFGTDREHLLSTNFCDRRVGRPSNTLAGVGVVHGGYLRVSYGVPRGSGGYTVFRPGHWVFEGTELRYGDLLGAEHVVAGFEADGCETTFDESGLPVPTHADGTPEGFEVLATSPARLWATEETPETLRGDSDELSDLEAIAEETFGEGWEQQLHRLEFNHAVMGTYTDGGTVFTTGCTDWAYGLAGRDPLVERITRNVLDRLGAAA